VLEFGLQTIHRAETRVIRRPNNLRKVERWARALQRAAIPFEVSLIYGLPLQTLETFRESVEFSRVLGPSQLVAWPLMLLRGIELERRKDDYALKEEVRLSPAAVTSGERPAANLGPSSLTFAPMNRCCLP
jgi:coproporphyrinogen III oxidase-like Fe-S oxidoreductase